MKAISEQLISVQEADGVSPFCTPVPAVTAVIPLISMPDGSPRFEHSFGEGLRRGCSNDIG